MQATPLFLGACALATLAGAVSGAAINTDPIQRASIGSDLIQRPDIAFDPSDTGHPIAGLPDQYAMTTPEGRVEVAELASRGLYAQRRYGWREAAIEPVPMPEQAFLDDDPEISEPAPAAGAEDTPALALAEPVEIAAVADTGQPKIIDVAAELASRR